jgi:hypothetical protein
MGGSTMEAARKPGEHRAADSAQPDKSDRNERTGAIEVVRPRRFARVPTHAIGVASERRRYPRAALALPLRLTQVGEAKEPIPVSLVTRNISSSGVYFLAPRWMAPGTPIEIEVALLDRPLGRGSVHLCTPAHVVRAEQASTPGWNGYAVSFDDIKFYRDDFFPQP